MICCGNDRDRVWVALHTLRRRNNQLAVGLEVRDSHIREVVAPLAVLHIHVVDDRTVVVHNPRTHEAVADVHVAADDDTHAAAVRRSHVEVAHGRAEVAHGRALEADHPAGQSQVVLR